MSLKESLELFIRSRRLLNLAPDSIKSYQNILIIFVSFVGEDINIKALSLSKVEDFILFQSDRNLSPATVSTYVRNVRIFLRWIHEEHGLSFDPSKIKVPKSPKKKCTYSIRNRNLISSGVCKNVSSLDYLQKPLDYCSYAGFRIAPERNLYFDKEIH